MGEEFFQPFEDVPGIVNENIPMFVYLTKITDSPFLSIYGPDVTHISLSTNEIFQGNNVNLITTINDFDNGNEIVTNDEVYIMAVGDTTFHTEKASNGQQMQLKDGEANSSQEQFELLLETSNYETGKYYLFVRGKDIGNEHSRIKEGNKLNFKRRIKKDYQIWERKSRRVVRKDATNGQKKPSGRTFPLRI